MLQIVALIVPIFAVAALGFAVTQRGLVDATAAEALNGFAFWIALPALPKYPPAYCCYRRAPRS